MKKSIIISDSFKGTLSSLSIADIFEGEYKKVFPNSELIKIPISDGGEGFLEMISSIISGKYITIDTVNPFFEKINASYYLSSDNIAYIETASSIGLSLIEGRLNLLNASSYGVGIMIKDAIKRKSKKIVIGLGGSSTNDFGCGMSSALGTKFYNFEGQEFIPTGGNLSSISRLDITESDKLLKGVSIVALSDVENPLYGSNGAAYTFAKQKGATNEEISILDSNLKYLSDLLIKDFNLDVSNIKGAGAAGGIGAAVKSFLHGTIKSGIKTILKMIKFSDLLEDVDVIFTGEGKFDSQSLNGKVISGIVSEAKTKNIPVIAICGGIEENMEKLSYNNYINALFSTNRKPSDYSVIKSSAKENYKYTLFNILKTIKLGENLKK